MIKTKPLKVVGAKLNMGKLSSWMDKRLWWVFLLGCSSGFPWVLIGSAMTAWLKDCGYSRSSIGLFGAVTAVYSINFLWAPFLDWFKLPGLQKKLGQRKSWILLTQIAIFIFTLLLALSGPKVNLHLSALFALAIAFFSSTQDIAIDAFRIDSFSQTEVSKMPQASAMATIGWWSGYSLPGFLAFFYADQYGWNNIYLGLTGFIVILIGATFTIGEPKTEREKLQQEAKSRYEGSSNIIVSLIEPIADFFRRNGKQLAWSILLFIFLFKIGEAFLGKMSIVFYKEIGFSNSQIGQYSKLVGWFATVIFTLIGSVINVRLGIIKGLMIGGIAMASSNLMFAILANIGASEPFFLASILVDNFTSAFATVAFVSFLTYLTGRAFSATQYALLASLGNFSRTVFASGSGFLVDYLNSWSLFFILTTIMVIPSLLFLYKMRHAFNFANKNDSKNNLDINTEN